MKTAFIWVAGMSLAALALPSASGQGAKILEPIRLTPDQVMILKSAARSVTTRKKSANFKLKGLEAQREMGQVRMALFSTLSDEQKEVQKTQDSFEKFSSTEEARQASKVFFGDILNLYSTVGTSLQVFKTQEYRIVRDNTLQLFDHTHSAYTLVAQRASLTFDLEVRSTPPEATVSHRRKGDAYTTHPRLTNTTIRNLVYATWQVRAELKGYRPQEKTYDPFRDPSNVLEFALQAK